MEYIKTLSYNKAYCWRKEKEYRTIHYGLTDDVGEEVLLKGLKLVAVYAGCNCDKKSKEKLKDFV